MDKMKYGIGVWFMIEITHRTEVRFSHRDQWTTRPRCECWELQNEACPKEIA